MNHILTNKKVSILCHVVLAIAVAPFLSMFSKSESLLFINGHNNPFLDQMMYHITRLPELALIIFVITLGLFQEKRIFFAVVLTMAVCGLSILLFKNVLFSNFDRPFQWLNAEQIPFHHVEGISLHSNGSFPSGHTMSAFCALALAGFISKNGLVQYLFFGLACLSAYSRVYVAQHYLMDVYAGALFGFLIALSIYSLFLAKFKTAFWTSPLIKLRK